MVVKIVYNGFDSTLFLWRGACLLLVLPAINCLISISVAWSLFFLEEFYDLKNVHAFVWIVQGCFLLNSTSSVNKTMCQHFGTLEQKVIAHFPSGCKKMFSKYNFHASESYWCWHYSFISTPDTANRSTTPLFCRDVEIEIISEFVKNSITNQQPGALYICGAPGTGKTASLTHVLESSEVWPSH